MTSDYNDSDCLDSVPNDGNFPIIIPWGYKVSLPSHTFIETELFSITVPIEEIYPRAWQPVVDYWANLEDFDD